MPKVTEEYIVNKKKKIVDAAYNLCLKKTVSTVTMQDIINETGLSQGGIYRFYKDIDEILADMIDRMRSESHFKETLDSILQRASSASIKDIVYDVFYFLGESMEKELTDNEKIDFELNILAMNAPDRVNKILEKTNVCGNKEYLSKKTTALFIQAEKEKKISFKIPLMELLAFIVSGYSGIQMTCIVNHFYHPSAEGYGRKTSALSQMLLLEKAVWQFIE